MNPDRFVSAAGIPCGEAAASPAFHPNGRLLVLAYCYPPENVPGAARPFRFAKFLPRFGYSVSVITASVQDRPVPDGVYYVPERFPFWAKALRRVLLPGEDAMAWVRAACRTAAGLHCRTPFSAVFSTSPPPLAHLAALQVKKRLGLPWIADFRDPLLGNPLRRHRGFPWLDRVLERLIFRHADAIVANTDAVATLWNRRHASSAHKISVIWNGFDPDEDVAPAAISPRPYRLLTHAGEVLSVRHPGLLLASIARLIARGALDPGGLRLELVGGGEEIIRALPDAQDLLARGVLTLVPLVPPPEAARRLAESDYLLLLDVIAGAPGFQVPSKIFNYLRIGRPVLALTTRNSPVDRILAQSGVPYACLYPDAPAEQIDGRVLSFLALPNDRVQPADWFWQNFDGIAQTRRLASILKDILADSTSGHTR